MTITDLEKFRHYRAWQLRNRKTRRGGHSTSSWRDDIHSTATVEDVYTDSKGIVNVVYAVPIRDVYRSTFGNFAATGSISTIVDFHTWLALGAHPSYWPTDRLATEEEMLAVHRKLGLSRSLSICITEPIPVDTYVYVVVQLSADFKNSSMASCRIYGEDGTLYGYGGHDKFKLYQRFKSPTNSEKKSSTSNSAKL